MPVKDEEMLMLLPKAHNKMILVREEISMRKITTTKAGANLCREIPLLIIEQQDNKVLNSESPVPYLRPRGFLPSIAKSFSGFQTKPLL